MATTILIVVLFAIVVIGLLVYRETTAVKTAMSQRLDIERQVFDSIRRVENVLAGASGKGSAGENIVELAFANFPLDWQVRNFTVNNKIVEFGIRLPDNLVLPIDSKFVATELLEEFLACEDLERKDKLKGRIHRQTEKRAMDIQKYLDASVTTSFGLAVVPDPLLAVCAEITASLAQQNVMLVSYSMLIPYTLLVFHLTLKTARSIDMRRLDSFVKSSQEGVDELQDLIQGRLAREIITLDRLKGEIQAQLSKLNANLVNLQVLQKPAPETGNGEGKLGAGA